MTFRDWFYDRNFTWNRIFQRDDLEHAFIDGKAVGYKYALKLAMTHLKACDEPTSVELLKSLLDPDPEQG